MLVSVKESTALFPLRRKLLILQAQPRTERRPSMKRDILLCIDLQAYLQTDDLVDENKPYYGTLTLDDEYHAQFVERPSRAYTRRNMRIFDGKNSLFKF